MLQFKLPKLITLEIFNQAFSRRCWDADVAAVDAGSFKNRARACVCVLHMHGVRNGSDIHAHDVHINLT